MIDFSKTHLSDEVLKTYLRHAETIGFKDTRKAMFSGKKINNSEDRSVLHTLLRGPLKQQVDISNADLINQSENAREQFYRQYEAIQQALAQRVIPISDIIHVGIGGSSLGTQLLFESLMDINESVNIHFMGNIDAHQLVSVLAKCSPNSTLVIGVSKTFTTAETLNNLTSIGQWFTQHGIADWRNHFYAVTASIEKAKKYGIADDNIVGFPEWVGGRYSVWSSVSLSAALVLGIDQFKSFLEGADSIDQYFITSELDENICFIAAALDHYYANFMGASSRAVFAYDFRLRSLVDYLQQLETESNGKDRQKNGRPVDDKTALVVWGGVGTDAQHSVFQMLHQGTSLIPSEFILVNRPDHEMVDHHQALLANGIAQTAALLAGQTLEQVEKMHADDQLPEPTLKAKMFSGDRPSSTILIDKLNARTIGALLAFYEHRTFCLGVFSNINSFDQMGVELGKRLAQEVKPLINNDDSVAQRGTESFDPSTLELVRRVLVAR